MRELQVSATRDTAMLDLVLETPQIRLDRVNWDTALPAFLAAFPHLTSIARIYGWSHLDQDFLQSY